MTSQEDSSDSLRDRRGRVLGPAVLFSCVTAGALGLGTLGAALAQSDAGMSPSPGPQVRRGSPPGTSPRRIVNSVSLVFTKADVRDVLTQIAGYTHADILITPGATGSISINLRNRTAEEAIRLVSAVSGLSVVRVGGAFIVGPAAEVQKAASEFGNSQAVPLRYITPADAVTVLTKLLPRVQTEPTANGVVISGLPGDMLDALTALRQIDVEQTTGPPPKSETGFLNVQAADPAETEKILHLAFPGIKMNRQDRTIIVTGAPGDLAAAQKAVQALDLPAPAAPEAREIFIYRLKFLNAGSAVTALRSALGGGTQPAATGAENGNDQGASAPAGPVTAGGLTITLAPEAIAPPAAVFNPLTSAGGFGGSTSTGGGTTSGGGGGGGATTGVGGAGGGPQQLSRPTRLILIGPKDKIDMARTLLEQTDLPQPLVRIEAYVVEVDTVYMKNLGLNWDVSGTNFTFNQPAGAGGLITGAGHATVALSALISQNHARMLASPNISVVDNEDASIFIGELRRFLGDTVLTPNAGTLQAVDSLPVGIALLIRPRIHPDGQVTLKVHPVISAVTSTVNGLPQTSSREADTTVRLRQGEELVIGGLDQTEVTKNVQKLPILGDLPLIGELFRNRTTTINKTTVVVIIRAFPVLGDVAPSRDFRKGITHE